MIILLMISVIDIARVGAILRMVISWTKEYLITTFASKWIMVFIYFFFMLIPPWCSANRRTKLFALFWNRHSAFYASHITRTHIVSLTKHFYTTDTKSCCLWNAFETFIVFSHFEYSVSLFNSHKNNSFHYTQI